METSSFDFKNTVFTVSSLNNLLKDIFENTPYFQHIHLQGELNGFKRHSSGHYFFTLRDDESTISAVIFSYQFKDDYANFKDGDLVEVVGSLNIYNRRGTYSFVISSMKHVGEGDVLLKKKQLIDKFSKLGYFDESRKKAIPKFPKTIGIITSPTGAAIADIEKNIRLRNKRVDLILFPCIVQGQEAPSSIISAIKLSQKYDLDTIIIGRGGGSNDDLSAFDDENVVKALYSLKTPVIAAIGHEIDKSICDYVADLSVSTPTAAAVAAVQDDSEILSYLDSCNREMKLNVTNLISTYKEKLHKVEMLDVFKNKDVLIEKIHNKIDNYSQNLDNAYTKFIADLKHQIAIKNERIENINPNNVLKRGYAIITNDSNEILKTVASIEKENNINITVSDGKTKIERK